MTEVVLVSRNSGSAKPSFGFAARFQEAVKVSQSPSGELYYSHALFPKPGAQAKACSFGFGDRPKQQLSEFKYVGPASYNPVHSVAYKRSPLDGKKFCTATLTGRPKEIKDNQKFPGPGAYDVIDKSGKSPAWKLGARLPDLHELEQIRWNKNSGTLSGPVPTTLTKGPRFGKFERFPKMLYQPNSPSGECYYSHNELYEKHYKPRATGLGKGDRPKFEVEDTPGPGEYQIITSCYKGTSAIDGKRPAIRIKKS
jgi:hypothetical protein